MIRTVNLTVAECEHTGELGLQVPHIADNVDDGALFLAFSPALLAHDVVEHMGSDTIGLPSDEIRALGAVQHVRIDSGELSATTNFNRDFMTLAYDVSNVLRDDWHGDIASEGQCFELGSYNALEAFERQELRKVAVQGAHIFIEEETHDVDEDELPSVRELAWPIYRLLIAGKARAQALYGNEYEAADIFRAVKDAASPIFAYISDNEGAQYTLVLDTDDRTCSIERDWEDEEERGCDDCAEWVDATHGTENSMGYFQCFDCEAKEEVKDLTREEIVEQLEGCYCVACYDEESTTELREALAENIASDKRDEA